MILIAIPFYQNTEFLKETIQSVCDQTSPQWLVTVFDDSTNPLEATQAKILVEDFNDSRIRYHRNPSNLGMANNWNQGLQWGQTLHQQDPLKSATVILHADDRLKPRYVEQMEKALPAHPEAAAFFCKTEIINEQGVSAFSFADSYKNLLLPSRIDHKIILKGTEGIRLLIPGNFIFCPSICYRNSSLSRLFKPELKMVTDFEFTLDLLLQEKTLIGLYEEPLFEYRRHSRNTTQLLNQNLVRFLEEKNLYRELARKLELKGQTLLSKQAAKMSILKKNLSFLGLTSLLKGEFNQSRRYWGFLKSLYLD